MTFISIQEALTKGKGTVAIRGWIYRERGSNEFKFIVVRDSSNIIQCVFKKEKFSPEDWDELDKLTVESSMTVEGILKEDKRAPTGYELQAEKFTVVQRAEPFPITKDQSAEFLLDVRHLSIRSRRLAAVMKIRHTVMKAFRAYFMSQKFLEMAPPIFTPNACEGGSTLFEVKYYKEKMYLTQSWQLYAEAAVFALERIFCISPCFRAEKSKTSRHLSEFWMAEMEATWIGLPELLTFAEDCVSHVVQTVLQENAEELKILERDVEKLKKIKAPFYRKTYAEVLKILEEKEGLKIPFGKDLRTIEEDLVMKHFDKPLMVTNYPKEIMAFYKKRDPKQPDTCLCFDMLAPEGYGEIIGGSERDTDVKELEKALKKEGEKIENYQWYLDTRRYGSVQHGGFGMGVERVVSWICGLDNIKDAIPFPRTMIRFKP
ncbi:MAG: asparagine--tRNA ligase [Candidatus Woesearchaeota archaeon]|nr:asparagine--tRNA ligase [Candidatus Woesearchaeota archaeon]